MPVRQEGKRGPLSGVQRMLRSLLPREEAFFGIFARAAENAVEGARVVHDLMEGKVSPPEAVETIERVEHQGDGITHECVQALNRTFVTPILFDRQDILDLAEHLDDIVDHMKAAVDRYALFDVREPRELGREMSAILLECTENLSKTMARMHELSPDSNEYCARINELENQGDMLLKRGLAELFRDGADPIEIIKWKEIYEHIEEAIDHCEDTVNAIKSAVVKNA